MQTDTERVWGMVSVITRSPLSRVVFWYNFCLYKLGVK
jgi:hypothetical protein